MEEEEPQAEEDEEMDEDEDWEDDEDMEQNVEATPEPDQTLVGLEIKIGPVDKASTSSTNATRSLPKHTRRRKPARLKNGVG